MKRLFVLLAMVVLILGLTSAPASAECASGSQGVTACVSDSGQLTVSVLGQQVLNTTITLPTTRVEVPVPTIVPGPTETVTVRIPGSEETIRVKVPVEVPVPGPTRTVTVTERVVVTEQGERTTVTLTPRPKNNGGDAPQTNPGPTPDAVPDSTPTVTETGQPLPEPDTIGPARPLQPKEEVLIDLPELTAPEAVGVGFLTLLALMGLLLLGMYGGYALGFKESADKDKNFMRELSDTIMRR